MRSVDAVVTGAGGFVGGHLVGALLRDGLSVRAVDRKERWEQWHPAAENARLDVGAPDTAHAAVAGAATVYHLAADMGGMGFIETNRAACMLSVLASTHVLVAARDAGVQRYFYSSSACVYPADRQDRPHAAALRESDVLPAAPEEGYGWEKLFSEQMARHFADDFGLATRVARYHNVYGEYGAWTGGREKAPAAICRKVALAALTGEHAIEVWGDGEQTRTFMYIDDCVHGTRLIAGSDDPAPVNLGSAEPVTVNELVDLVAKIAGVDVQRRHVPGPQGVRGRSSDNTEIRRRLGWEPSTPLAAGLERTYAWIHDRVRAAHGR